MCGNDVGAHEGSRSERRAVRSELPLSPTPSLTEAAGQPVAARSSRPLAQRTQQPPQTPASGPGHGLRAPPTVQDPTRKQPRPTPAVRADQLPPPGRATSAACTRTKLSPPPAQHPAPRPTPLGVWADVSAASPPTCVRVFLPATGDFAPAEGARAGTPATPRICACRQPQTPPMGSDARDLRLGTVRYAAGSSFAFSAAWVSPVRWSSSAGVGSGVWSSSSRSTI